MNYNKLFSTMTKSIFLKKLNKKYADCERKKLFLELLELYCQNKSFRIYYKTDHNDLKKEDYFSFLCIKKSVENDEILDNLCLLIQQNFDLKIDVNINCFSVSIYEKFIDIRAFDSTHIIYEKSKNAFSFPYTKYNDFSERRIMQIEDLEKIYCIVGKRRFPFRICDFEMYKKLSNLVKPFYEILFQKLIDKNIFFKDVFKTFPIYSGDTTSIIFPKIQLKQIYKSHNMRELMALVLKKKLESIPNAVNFANICNAYNVTSVILKFPKNLQQKLFPIYKMQIFTDGMYDNFSAVLTTYYANIFEIDVNDKRNSDLITTIQDYIQMSQQSEVSLDLKTYNSLLRKHDEIVQQHKKYTNNVEIKISENSIFNLLNLPEKYERITTTERLFAESKRNHNCVFSYVNRINVDKCAIFSLIQDEKRYTIEIVKNQNKFVISQFLGVCNSTCPKELYNELRKYLM